MCVCSMLMWTDHGTILDIFVYRMASPILVIDSLCYMIGLDMSTYRLYTYAPRLIVNSFILNRTIFIVNRISNGYCNILYIVNEVSFCVNNYMDNYYYYVILYVYFNTHRHTSGMFWSKVALWIWNKNKNNGVFAV